MKTAKRFTALMLAVSFPVFAQPKIEIVGGESLDFGLLYKGDRIDRKVMIRNIGSRPLVIDRVQASCGCTATLLEEKTIQPGKTTSLSIGFDSKNFYGEVRKSVTVFSNDTESLTKEIRFKALVKEALTITPPYVFFMAGKVDSVMTSSTTLKNMSDERITILSVSSPGLPDAAFTLKRKSLEPGEATQLAVTYTPSKVGYMNHDVVISTSHPRQREITMKVVCNVLRGGTQPLPAGEATDRVK